MALALAPIPALVSTLRLSVVAYLLAALCWVAPLQARAAPPGPSLKITILSTMVTDFGSVDKPTFGEWGFAALVEVQGKKLLFDSGRSPELVLKNALALGIDLSDVEDVVLSHFHMDHTGGLLYLRAELKKQNPRAMSHLHVNKGFFESRRGTGTTSQVEGNQMIAERTLYEAGGGTVHTYAKATELAPGLWLSGPVPRVTQERNWSGSGQVRLAGNWVDDKVPESLSLFIASPEGTIVLSGCGHAGIVNITRHAETV